MVTYRDCLLPIRSNDHIVTWFSEITRQTKNIITTMPIAAKLGRMMTYLEWLLPIKSHVFIIIWSCKISWQTEIIMYPLAQCLWQPILIYNEDFPSIKSADPSVRKFNPLRHTTLSICGLVRSWDKLKISPLPQHRWPPNQAWWLYTMSSLLL